MSAYRSLLLILALFVPLAAAQAAPPYEGPPLRFAVDRIEIEDAYVPPLRDPHIGHLSPLSPGEAAEAWAASRLVAAGGGVALARVVITDAPLTEEELEQESGFRSLFTTQQSERYAGRIAVRISFLDADGRQLGALSAEAERSQTIAEDATLGDREALWVDIAEKLAADIDAQVRKVMARDLPSYLR
jgi:hypothetical protein